MKQLKSNSILVLFCLILSIASPAQLRNDALVIINNLSNHSTIIANGPIPNVQALGYPSGTTGISFNWRVIVLPGNYYQFRNRENNLYLGTLNRTGKQNLFVAQQEGNPRQQDDITWSLIRTTRGFKIKNKKTNLVIAIGRRRSDGMSELVQVRDDGGADKEWQFITIGSGASEVGGNKVLFDVVLNYIAVSEATRNRIDNGDCRRVFGEVITELWELDVNNEKKTKLRSYENMPELIFQETNYNNPPTAGLSYYQDDRTAAVNNQMGKVTYNIPDSLLINRKIMLIVKTNLGTRHKDNDFASFDALKMKEQIVSTFIVNGQKKTETIQSITDLNSSDRNMGLSSGYSIPGNNFQHTDDTHKIWVTFTCKKN